MLPLFPGNNAFKFSMHTAKTAQCTLHSFVSSRALHLYGISSLFIFHQTLQWQNYVTKSYLGIYVCCNMYVKSPNLPEQQQWQLTCRETKLNDPHKYIVYVPRFIITTVVRKQTSKFYLAFFRFVRYLLAGFPSLGLYHADKPVQRSIMLLSSAADTCFWLSASCALRHLAPYSFLRGG